MKTNYQFLSLAACLAIAGSQTLPARELLKLVRLESDAAAGTPADFNTFASAIINNSNEIGYRATLRPGSGVNSSNNLGIWQDDANVPYGAELIARESFPAPGTGGATFSNLINSSTFQINDQGDMLFRARLTGPGVNTSNDFGIWYRPGGGSGALTLVAREGDPAPGTDGVFAFVDFPTQSDNAGGGEVYFKAELTGGTTTIFNNNALYGYIGGVLTLIHREGDVTPVLPVGSGGPGTTATYGDFTADPMISSDGKLAFSANISGVPSNRNEVLFIRDGGITSAVMQEDTPLPDATGTPTAALISRFTSYTINDSSEFIVRVGLRFGGGVSTSNNEAIITSAGGPFRLLAREGDVTPEGGTTFRSFRNIYLGNSGATGLYSLVFPIDDSIYSAASGGALVNIAKEGTAAAGTDTTYSQLGRPSMNHAGQLLYTANLVNFGTTDNSNNAGLWRTAAAATPPTVDELISRKGDWEDDICGNIVAYELNAPNLDAAGVSGTGRSINDNDNLVVGLITTTTGTGQAEGIYILGDHPPVFCDAPSDQLRNIPAGAGPIAVSWVEPTVMDDDTTTPPTLVSSHAPGSSFSPGVTIVTYTATDSGGNISTLRFRVIVTEIRDLNKEVTADFVARNGDPAPDSGENFRVFSGVCMNDSGQVTFEASTDSGLRGIWSDGSGSLVARALTGDIVFGTTSMNRFSDFRITPGGRSAFTTSLVGIGVGPTNDRAHIIEHGSGANSLAAAEGDGAPGTSGGAYLSLYQQAVSQRDGLEYSYYPARLLRGAAVTTRNDTGIWYFDAIAATGSVKMVQEGDPVVDLPGLDHGSVSQRTVTGGNARYVFASMLTGPGVPSAANMGLFSQYASGGPASLMARKGGIAPGPDPFWDGNSRWKKAESTLDKITRRDTGRFRVFLGESISPNGQTIAFHASLARGDTVTSSNDTGIWFVDSDGFINFVARESHQAPGMPDGVCFSRFEDIVATDDGEVWFRAYLTHDATLGINSSNDCGIWTTDDGFLRWFVHEGELAPNTDGGVVRSINAFSYDGDGIAATLTLVAGSGDVLPNNSRSLTTGFAGLTGLFETNLRKGDLFEETPGIFRTISLVNIVQPFNAANGSGGFSNAVSGEAEQVVLKASFNGNGNGIILRDLSDVGP